MAGFSLSMQLREEERKPDDSFKVYEQLTSWTDDVPTCRESGIGSAINELYRRDGSRIQLHPCQDRCFRFRVEENDLCVYGVLDGFQGAHVSDFVAKRIPAELLWGQLVPEKSDEAIRETLRQAFISVDKEYFESIGDRLAARMVMKCDPHYASSAQLRELEEKVGAGCTGILTVVLGSRLFIATTGDCRALLYREGEILPLWMDHTTANEDEVLRLAHLGVDLSAVQQPAIQADLGDHLYTRCFGNYPVKGGYKEKALLANSRDEPVIAEPEVYGAIEADQFSFLLLYTRSLWQAVAEATRSPDPDLEIAQLCQHYLNEETSLSGAAQAVVDQVVRLHHDALESSGDKANTREDMTLLIRELDKPLPNTESRRDSKQLPEKTLTRSSASRPARPTRSSTATESSSVYITEKEIPVDEHGRIQPYVDFCPFYELWNQRKSSQPASDLSTTS